MRYPKLRELKEVIRAMIRGPYTRGFPFKKHIPYARFRGKTEFHKDDCVGCSACFQVCPAKAIEMEDKPGKRVLRVRWDLCVFCGQCQANCLTGKGIMLSNEFDLSTTGKRDGLVQEIEKEMVLCECCSKPVAPYDQMLWVAKRLGFLCFTNTTLMMFYLRYLDLVGNTGSITEKPAGSGAGSPVQEFTRSDRLKILCPLCRREAVYKS